MSGLTDPPAHEVFRADLDVLDKHARHRAWLNWPARLLGAFLGFGDDPVFGDVVVRRISDQSEIVRIPVSGSEESAIELDEISSQLHHLTEAEFIERWTPAH